MIIKKADGRLWEIDFLRGIAVVSMIGFHFAYDLKHFSIIDSKLYSGYVIYAAAFIAAIFLLLAGVSLTISYSKAKEKLTKKEIKIKYIKRGSEVFLLGMVITVISLIVLPELFVIFGVLHCIGISIIFSIPFIKYRLANLFLGFLFIGFGLYLKNFTFDFNFLVAFGFLPHLFSSIDYFPIFPWFGVVLVGIAIGNFAFPNAKRRFSIRDFSENYFVKGLCFVGRHSLLIYFLHQPILIGLIFILLM